MGNEWAACIATTDYKRKQLAGKRLVNGIYSPNLPVFPMPKFSHACMVPDDGYNFGYLDFLF